MKKQLYFKLFIGYLLFGILGFILVSVVTSAVQLNYLQNHTAANLYREATVIANRYATDYYNHNLAPEDIQEHIEILDDYLSAQIWLIDKNGNVLLNSRKPADIECPEVIEDFNVTDFGNKYFKIGDFYHYFSEDTLSVFSPITLGYQVKGYIVIHQPLTETYTFNNHLLNMSYLTLGLLALCLLFLLGLLVFFIIHPIRKLAKGVKRNAEGDFSEKISVHTNDEIGYLAASIEYMANEMNTLEEDQR